MSNSRTYSKRANEVLRSLNEEKICSAGDTHFNTSLNYARAATMKYAAEFKVIAPGLTACVATTLLKKGLCQELCQRFALEYCIKYREKNVSLIFLSNPAIGHTKEDHTLVYIGPIKVPNALIIGKGDSDLTIEPEKNNLSLVDFLKSNKEGVIADPLLKCAGISDEEIMPLLDYCKKYNITHIVGVRSYGNTPGLVENALLIKGNAMKIAEKINPNQRLKPNNPKPLTTKKIKEHLQEVKKIECKEGASDYIQRLEAVLGKDVVKKDKENKNIVSFPVFWLKQLGDTAIKELSSGLGVPQINLRP